MAKYFQGAALSLIFSFVIIPSFPVLPPILFCTIQTKRHCLSFHWLFFFFPGRDSAYTSEIKTTIILFSPLSCMWQSKCVHNTQLSFSLTQPAWHCQRGLIHATSGRSETRTKSSREEGLQPISGCYDSVPMARARHSWDHSVDSSPLLMSSPLQCSGGCCCIKVFWIVWANAGFSQILQRKVQNLLNSQSLDNPLPGRFLPNLP